MTTPGIMSSILADLRDRIEDAEQDARESHLEAMNSYGAGFDRGYADALMELWESITGDKYEPTSSDRQGAATP